MRMFLPLFAWPALFGGMHFMFRYVRLMFSFYKKII